MPEGAVRVEGRVVEQLPNALYRVELASNGTADLSVDSVPVSGSCGDSLEVCGVFRWIRFRIH